MTTTLAEKATAFKAEITTQQKTPDEVSDAIWRLFLTNVLTVAEHDQLKDLVFSKLYTVQVKATDVHNAWCLSRSVAFPKDTLT